MNGPAIHLAAAKAPNIAGAGHPECGQDGWTVHEHLTSDPAKVTCRRCLAMRRMTEERNRRASEQLEQIRRDMRLLGGAP